MQPSRRRSGAGYGNTADAFHFTAPEPSGDGMKRVMRRALKDAKMEPSLAEAQPGDHYQFMRQGYFFVDPVDSKPGKPIFNRTVGLRDTWAKISGKK